MSEADQTPALLLDANVLIAWVVGDHEHHGAVVDWLVEHPDLPLALCPVTEGALLRYLLRQGESGPRALRLLRELLDLERVVFWAATTSHVSLDGASLRGHRQVTDDYLVALAEERGGRLLTLDKPLARRSGDKAVQVLVGPA